MCVLQTAREDGHHIEWEQAKGFSKYLISTNGHVYSIANDRLLLQGRTERGYMQVDVYNDECIKKHMRVHRLVYMAHKGSIPKGLQINHMDENKENNCIENLSLMTSRENSNRGTVNKRRSKALKRFWSMRHEMAIC